MKPDWNDNAALDRAKALIDRFCMDEYGSPADFSDLSRVGVAYTTLTDDEIPAQVYVDLVSFSLDRYLNGLPVEHAKYGSLDALIDAELNELDFDYLVSFTDDQFERASLETRRELTAERPKRNELPETCFSTLPDTGELVTLQRGKAGYAHSDRDMGDRRLNREIADFYNGIDGLTPAQTKAMESGCVEGFDSPGADPQTYLDGARLVSRRAVRGELFGADAAASCPDNSELFKYQVAGHTAYYLPLEAVPREFMAPGSGVILHVEMVGGRPLVPAKVALADDGAGKCYMALDSGSFSRGEEVNESYHITAKVGVGPVEYVLGETEGKHKFFVTWERTPGNDGSGPPNYYWGHYFEKREDAIRDFAARAEAKFEMLTEQRKPSIRAQLAAAKSEQRDTPATRSKEREAR